MDSIKMSFVFELLHYGIPVITLLSELLEKPPAEIMQMVRDGKIREVELAIGVLRHGAEGLGRWEDSLNSVLSELS